ncbi:MAG: hypothetical protein ACTSWQ_09195, partial [Candidatus Thorarchaeota archaeon]
STGDRCKRQTSDSSGYCQLHRDQYSQESEFGILRCKHCPIQNCEMRDTAPKGMCKFELDDETRDFDTKAKVLKAMREVMRTEYTLKGRIERELSRVNLSLIGTEDDTGRIVELFKMYTSVSNSLSVHLERFGKFMGFEAIENVDKSMKKKMEKVDRILNKKKKERIEQKKVEEIVQK